MEKVYKTHGLSKHKLYPVWQNMLHAYGYFSIPMVCEEWFSVETFIRDVEPTHKDGSKIERINDSCPFSKDNFQWVPATNNRRMVSYNGQCMCISQWAKHFGILPTTLLKRMQRRGEAAALRELDEKNQ